VQVGSRHPVAWTFSAVTAVYINHQRNDLYWLDFRVLKLSMNASDTPSVLKQLRKASWKFQQTFKTLKKLEPFVASIISTGGPQTACVTIEQIVFEPKNLIDQLTRYSLPPRCGKGASVTATGRHEIEELLQAAFADWVDFLFVPSPKPFVIYADHDEYATFYANTRSNLNRISEALSLQGFEKIAEYTRPL